MKNLLKITLLFLLTFTLFNCDEETEDILNEVQIEDISALKTDKVFTTLLEENINILSRNIDSNRGINYVKAQDLLEKENLTEYELNSLAIYMGFNDGDEMTNFYNNQKERLIELEDKYHLSSYNEEEIIKSISPTELSLNLSANGDCTCRSTLTNCLINAGITSVSTAVTCIVDPTAGCGLGAALLVGGIEAAACVVNYALCDDDCAELEEEI